MARAGTRRPSTDGAPGLPRQRGPDQVGGTSPAPRARHSSASSSTSRTGSVGSAKIAVPTWTATAPTARKSRTSASSVTPPIATTGMSTIWADLVDDPQRDGLDRRAATARRRCCRAAASLRAGATAIPRQRVDRGQRVGAGVGDRPGDRADVGDVRRELDEQRQVRRAADGGRDLGRGARVDRELEPAPADVRAADVELDPGDAGHAVEPADDLDVVVDRLAGDVDDDRRLPAGPGRRRTSR